MGRIFGYEFGTPTRIHQMIETCPGDISFFEKVEYCRYLIGIEFIDGKPQADLNTGSLAVFDAR